MSNALLIPDILTLVFDECDVATLDACSAVCTFWESCAVSSLRRRELSFTAAAHAYLRQRAPPAFLAHCTATLNATAYQMMLRTYGVLYMTDSNTVRRFKVQPASGNITQTEVSLTGKRSALKTSWPGVLDYIISAYTPIPRREWVLSLLVDTMESGPCTEHFAEFHLAATREHFDMGQRAKYLAARSFVNVAENVMVYRPFYMPRFFLSLGNDADTNARMDAIMTALPGAPLTPTLKFLPMIEWSSSLKRKTYYPYLIGTPKRHFDIGVLQRDLGDPPPRQAAVRSRAQFAFELRFEKDGAPITRVMYKRELSKCVRLLFI